MAHAIQTVCTDVSMRDWFEHDAPGFDFHDEGDFPSRRHYVYVLVEDSAPFYVGFGTGRRWRQHWDKPSEYNVLKDDKIASLKKRGIEPAMCVVIAKSHLTLNQAGLIEQALILAIGRIPNGPLLNLSDGGESGTFGYKWTPEQMLRHASRRPEVIAKIVAKNKGSHRSAVALANMRVAQQNNPLAGQHRLGVTETSEQTYNRLELARTALAEQPFIWITDGTENAKILANVRIPAGWWQSRTFSEAHKAATLAASSGPRSAEVRASIKAGHAGIWDDPEKRARMMENRRPFEWYTNGVDNKRVSIGDPHPEHWRRGMTRPPTKAARDASPSKESTDDDLLL